MTFDFIADLRKTEYWPIIEIAGGSWQLECKLDAEVDEWDADDCIIRVRAVRVGTLNLLTSKCDIERELGVKISDMAEQDDDFKAEVIADAGISWTGRGYGDPDGRYFMREAAE